MNKGCDIENNIDIKENPVQVAKKVFGLSNPDFSFKSSNTECITELKKVRKNNSVIMAILNINSLISKFDDLKVIIGQRILIFE